MRWPANRVKAQVLSGDETGPAQTAFSVCTGLLEDRALPAEARYYVHYYRARAAMRKPDLAAALSDLDEAIRLDPSEFASFATRGIVHGTQGNLTQAVADFSRAIELNPKDAVSFESRGKAYSDSGNQPRAIQDFSRSIAMGNDVAATRNGRCWARAILGVELALAREDCDAATRMAPTVGNAFNSRAFVRFRSGDLAGAISDYTKALSLDPSGASSYYMRGRAMALVNDPTSAADIEKGVRLEPGIAERYAGYGVAQQ